MRRTIQVKKLAYFPVTATIVLLGIFSHGQNANGQQHRIGVFYGILQLQPTGDGKTMKVIEPYSYVDADGHAFSAQPGFQTDGASIPRVLWSLIGSPFTGKYIGAAVVHDVGCTTKKYSWQVTHRMFYDAMLDSGVSEHTAKIMYYGVRFGGPKWQRIKITAKNSSELSKKIQQSGALIIHEASGTTGTGPKQAAVTVEVPASPLTSKEIKAFENELSRREKEGQTISLIEIEQRTPEPVVRLPEGTEPLR
jgi:hypothetical protein